MTTGTISSETMVGHEQMIVLSGKLIRKKKKKEAKEFGHLPANGNMAHGKPCLLDLAYVPHEID